MRAVAAAVWLALLGVGAVAAPWEVTRKSVIDPINSAFHRHLPSSLNDGWPDLYVTNEFGGNALYHNEGNGRFTDRTGAAGVADGGTGMGVAWADYDGDSDLDLFVSNMHANSGWGAARWTRIRDQRRCSRDHLAVG